MTYDECFRTGRLHKGRPDQLKAKKSLEIAEQMLNEAKKLMDDKHYSSVIIQAYASMFHSLRALLFKDGVEEKAHYCVISYVSEKYCKTGEMPYELVTIVDSFRIERHEIFYGLEKHELKEGHCLAAIENAEKLLAKAKSLV